MTPGYRNIVAAGGIVNNPCTYVVEDWSSDGSGYVRATSKPNPTAIWEQHGPLVYHYSPSGRATLISGNSPTHATADVARAKLEALANIDPTPYSFGEDTAELKETIQFLRRPMGELYDLARSFYQRHGRRTVRQVAKIRTKQAAKAVLEFQYAASPLVRSSFSALEAWTVRNDQYVFPARRTSRGFENLTEAISGSFTTSSTTFAKRSDYEQDVKASILYEVTNPCDNMEWRLGLRSKDFPVTMWQIVPLSFMVDRVYDVSGFLKASINLGDPKVKILSACVRKKTNRVRQWWIVGRTSSYYTFSFASEVVSYKIFTYEREPWSPSFSDTIPQVKPVGLVNEATKVLELASVLLNKFL